MTIQYQNKQLSTKRLGSLKINKIMLGTQEIFPRVQAPISITVPGGVPHMTQYTPIEAFQIVASGGTAPYVFTVVSGGFPDGITMSTGGYVSGTPQTAGYYTITVRVDDAANHFGSFEYTGFVETGDATFTPASLFDSNEQGVWGSAGDLTDEKLSWRRNLLLNSEKLDVSPWTAIGCTITENFDGEYAKIVTDTGALLCHQAARSQPSTIVAGKVALSATAKIGGGLRYLSIGLHRGNGGTYTASATYDLQTGLPVTINSHPDVAGGFSQAMVADGDGWRCTAMFDYKGTAGVVYVSGSLSSDGSTYNRIVTGDGTSGILVKNVQLEQAATATAYQKITDFNTEFLAAFPNHALFQESTGLTPVTATEQPVGLILDKRLHLAKIADIIPNGDFSAGLTGWTFTGNWQVNGAGQVECIANGNLESTTQLVVGKWYEVEFDIVGALTNTVNVFIGVGNVNPFYVGAVGRKRVQGYCATDGRFIIQVNGTPQAFDNISVKEIAGNHITQPTASKRPKWAGAIGQPKYFVGDGADDDMAATVSFTSVPEATFSVLASSIAGSQTTSSLISQVYGSSTTYAGVGFRQSIAAARFVCRDVDGASTVSGVTDTFPMPSLHILIGYSDADNAYIENENGLVGSGAIVVPPYTGFTATQIQAFAFGIPTNICEIVHLNRAMTVQEKSDLVAYYKTAGALP